MQKFAKGFVIRTLSMLAFLLVWQTMVTVLQPDMLPSPTEVFGSLWHHMVRGELLMHLGVTLQRVGLSFSIALAVGFFLGLLMGHFRKVDACLDGIVTLALNVPALVTIILCFIWFGLNEFSAILAVIINKAPNAAVTFREGAKNVDRQLLEVARVFDVSPWYTLRNVYLPQLYPYFLAASRSGLALVWKIVLVVELIGCSEGIGFQLGVFFQFFDITSILAYTLAFAAIVYALEALVIRPWERSVMRWRA